MPAREYTKIRPFLSTFSEKQRSDLFIKKHAYAELQVTSNFSLLRGASHPEELVTQAALLGYHAIGIADLHTFSGVVRAHTAARQHSMQFLVGCRFLVRDIFPNLKLFLSIIAYPTCKEAYQRLCRLLTIRYQRAHSSLCGVTIQELLDHDAGNIFIIIPPYTLSDTTPGLWNEAERDLFLATCTFFRERCVYPHYLSMAINTLPSYNSSAFRDETKQLSMLSSIPLVLTNDVHFHIPERKALHDVVTCIREKCTLTTVGTRLLQHQDRYLKPIPELVRLSRELVSARERTVFLAEAAGQFSLQQLTYEYPRNVSPQGTDPHTYLCNLVSQGAEERYPQGVPLKVKQILKEELELIRELSYAKYFLTCYDIVRFARSVGILCQGRGAAANSAVCFCLGITSVDPDKIDLLFGRFISKERNEPPDIDIDFEHERREEVIQYIYRTYGRDHAALTAIVVTYRHRSAVRDIGKALGLPVETVSALASSIHRWTRYEIPRDELLKIGVNPESNAVRNTLVLAQELIGFPRHLSQHVGGFIISEAPLCEIVPILPATMESRTIVEWDKDDIEMLGMLKIDVLALGMLTCIRKALELVNAAPSRQGLPPLELHTIPAEDPAVYDMACRADTIGVFQIESRAQMSMLPRLKPRCFYDLVIEVAIVRPGPIQGDMIHPYLKRRDGKEKLVFPDERVKNILQKTLGVPLFQEQAMRLAIVLAQFTPGEAEQLRRAMAAWKRNEGVIAQFKTRIIDGMTRSGYSVAFAETCMNQIKGFAEYGFPESHAASFALLVYASLWLKCHHPALFTTALLNSLPMGFYAPAQLIADVQAHGVTVLPVDVNFSLWDSHIEYAGSTPQIRLGMRLVHGVRQEDCVTLSKTREKLGSFGSIPGLWYACHQYARQQGTVTPYLSTLKCLARADAFRSLHKRSRAALWEIQALPQQPTPLALRWQHSTTKLSEAPLQQEMFQDYAVTDFSLRAHPLEFVREQLKQRHTSTASAIREERIFPHGKETALAGLAIVRQRPGTARGVVFLTIEDETGLANLIIRPEIFERFRTIIIMSAAVWAFGQIQRTGSVVYLSVYKIESLDSFIFKKPLDKALPSKSYSY